MKRSNIQCNKLKLLGLLGVSCFSYLTFISPHEPIEAAKSVATHIGTFEGSTTFTTSSSNGINPGLFIEVMDEYGNLTQYESEDGVITILDTQEGAYVTQAKLLGKTKYIDEGTGEVLDRFEEGRNLRLASSENPGLMTVGKNLFDGKLEEGMINVDGDLVLGGVAKRTVNFIEVKPNTTYSLSCNEGYKHLYIHEYDENYANIIEKNTINSNTFTTESNTKYIKFNSHAGIELPTDFEIQLENASAPTSYTPHQSNILYTQEDVVLRSLPNRVRDTLNLMTGEYKQSVDELVLDGTQQFTTNNPWSSGDYWTGWHSYQPRKSTSQALNCDKLPVVTPVSGGIAVRESVVLEYNTKAIYLSIAKNKGVTNPTTLYDYLRKNPITIQFELETPMGKTIRLNSDYFFKPIHTDSIQVMGVITPLVGSVIVPTTPVSFVLDPNQEARQQFIAPEFSVSNEANAPIKLALNSFEQTTNVLTDVLPDKYNSWEGLNKKESKDIALALVPKMSDGWLSLNEGPRYVAGALSNELGTIKAKSSVDFTFSALHGQAFEETLSPSYRLGFVFEFMN